MTDTEPVTGSWLDVEIAQAGDWNASTGEATITPADLASCVQAFTEGLCPTAPIKIGHVDPRFSVGDGDPAFGWVENLHLSADGQSLRADLVGIPRKLADAGRTAYRKRSAELWKGVTVAGGRTYAAVLKAVALLGVTPPAITGMDDVLAYYSGAGMHVTGLVEITLSEGDTATVPHASVTSVNAGPAPLPTVNEGIHPVATIAEQLRTTLGLPATATDAVVSQALTLLAPAVVDQLVTPPVVPVVAPVAAVVPPVAVPVAVPAVAEPVTDEPAVRATIDPVTGLPTLVAAEPAVPAVVAPVVPVIPAATPVPELIAASAGLPAGTVMLSQGQYEALMANSVVFDTARRASLIDDAVRTGRINVAESVFFSAQLIADEAGTTQVLANLHPGRYPMGELGQTQVSLSAANSAETEMAASRAVFAAQRSPFI